MPHRQARCTQTLHSPIHGQAATFLPSAQRSQCDKVDGQLPECIQETQALPYTTPHFEQPPTWRVVVYVLSSIQLGGQRCTISFPIAQGTKTRLLHQ